MQEGGELLKTEGGTHAGACTLVGNNLASALLCCQLMEPVTRQNKWDLVVECGRCEPGRDLPQGTAQGQLQSLQQAMQEVGTATDALWQCDGPNAPIEPCTRCGKHALGQDWST